MTGYILFIMNTISFLAVTVMDGSSREHSWKGLPGPSAAVEVGAHEFIAIDSVEFKGLLLSMSYRWSGK